ncbi:hypothetical protein [Nitrospira sp. BLG_2]
MGWRPSEGDVSERRAVFAEGVIRGETHEKIAWLLRAFFERAIPYVVTE